MSLAETSSLQAVVVFLVGICLGSFLNVIVVRLPRGRSLISPSSRCGFCRSSLKFWMNIPILSFLWTAGRCSYCGHAYSARYPLVEFLMGVLSVALWSVYGWTLAFVLFLLFVAALVAVCFIDLEFKIIPDSLSLGGWAVALILSCLSLPGYSMDFSSALAGSLLGYGVFWLLSRVYYWLNHEEGLGGGDVKLMGFIGAVLGMQGALTTILVGSLAGTVVGLFFMIIFKKTKRFPIPFGPFLVLGAFVSVFQLDLWWWQG